MTRFPWKKKLHTMGILHEQIFQYHLVFVGDLTSQCVFELNHFGFWRF